MPRRDCRLTCLLESRLGTPSSFSSCGRAQSRTRAASLCQSRLQRVQRVTHNVPEGYLVHYAARPEARHHYSANSNPQCFQKTNLSTTSATITQRGPHATQRILVRIAISSLVPHTRKTFCSLYCPDHLAGLARGVGCSLVTGPASFAHSLLRTRTKTQTGIGLHTSTIHLIVAVSRKEKCSVDEESGSTPSTIYNSVSMQRRCCRRLD